MNEPQSRPRIGTLSAAAIVVANMIGAGVFTTSGFSLGDLQSPQWVMLAWAVGGVVAMCGALSYGALARRIPESGGEYTFLAQLVHPLAGFLAGWVSLLAGFTAPIAAAALGLQAYLVGSSDETAFRPEWLGTAAIAVAGLIHGLRLREGVGLQNAAVALKLAAIAGFVVLGVFTIPSPAPGLATAPAEAPFDLGAFAVTLVWISFAYSGWNAAVYVAGEIENPERNLPRALVLGTATTAVVYLALNAVFVFGAPFADLVGRPDVGAAAAQALGGDALRRALSILVALALFTSITAMVMVGPRVYQRMADDGLFPQAFAAVGEVPGRAVALQVVLSIALVWSTTLAKLLGYIGFTLGISGAATVVALLLTRRREGAERVPIPGYPLVPLVYVVSTLGASAFMIQREPWQAAVGLLTLSSGVPLYWLAARQRSEPS